MASRRRLRQTVSESLGSSDGDGTGTSETDPENCLDQKPAAPSDRVCLVPGKPLRLAAQIVLRAASNASAAGNQPTGMSPSSFDSRSAGSNWITATAFCVPLAT